MRILHALIYPFSSVVPQSVTLITNNAHKKGAAMALPIILDCDPGHDDAIAIVLALASPELDVKAITSSAGNQTPEKTLRNVLRMLTRVTPGYSGRPAARVSR